MNPVGMRFNQNIDRKNLSFGATPNQGTELNQNFSQVGTDSVIGAGTAEDVLLNTRHVIQQQIQPVIQPDLTAVYHSTKDLEAGVIRLDQCLGRLENL